MLGELGANWIIMQQRLEEQAKKATIDPKKVAMRHKTALAHQDLDAARN